MDTLGILFGALVTNGPIRAKWDAAALAYEMEDYAAARALVADLLEMVG